MYQYVTVLINFLSSRYYERHPDQYLKPGDGYIIGVGVGLLSAAAVACSRTLVDLPQIAVKLVGTAFRSEAVIDRILRQLHQPDGAEENWSIMIPGATEPNVQAELDTFHDRTV